MIQEEEGQGKRADDRGDRAGSETEEVGSLCQAAPLAAILGKLPSAASLGLEQNSQESTEKPDGEKRHFFITHPHQQGEPS